VCAETFAIGISKQRRSHITDIIQQVVKEKFT